ncbi:hypothetical protein BSL78_30094 [Apostichopus japonicus]|uniref:Uncharacterized protein n=1 Tax=Stichopus japonicus TaxID=307972 RepID=A0A2G8JBH8_STIJA|nr:hypothetical protein BSL78_30094 [Apostichopus japonicus]
MFFHCRVYLYAIVAVVLFLSGQGTCEGKKPKSGNLRNPERNIVVAADPAQTQPQPDGEEVTKQGECTNFNLKVFINIKYYSCCGGIKNSTVKDEPEYPNFQCNPSRFGYAELNVSKSFDCNGPEGQGNAKTRCSERWGWFDDPESCWVWSECFEGACAKETLEIGSSTKDETAFCGDGRCDANSESSANCPIDCCQSENPVCVPTNNTCPDACCSESHCCNGPTSATQQLVQKLWMAVLGILAGLLILINIICCCCCYCCYSKCCKKNSTI